jgi:tetratricopeptide (TPR) repeat protein
MVTFRRALIAVLFVVMTVMLSRPAAADDADLCSKESGDAAIAACTRAITSGNYRGNNLANLFLNRGVEYGYKGDNDRAIQDYDQAIRLDTNYVRALLNRGNSFFLAGNYDQAIADYEAVVRFNPKSAYGLYGRGMVKLKKGDDAGGNADIIVAKVIQANITEVFAKYDIQP